MKRILIAIVLVSVSMMSLGGFAAAQGGSGSEAQVELPAIPAAVTVELDAAKTAFLVLDLIDSICQPRPMCVASLPNAANLLAKARAANAMVVYSMGTRPATVLPEVAPRGDEPVVMSSADKFFRTNLEQILTDAGIETVVIVGTLANGAPMYTAFGANARGLTAVVAEDAISGDTDFDVFLTRYQLLNQAGFNNPQNTPLAPQRVTLSRTDLITFK